MKRNKIALLAFFLICVCILVLCVADSKQDLKPESCRLEVVQVKPDGYGYHILRDDKLLINQPFIPAVSGKKAFSSAEDAKRVGTLVMKRLNAGDNFAVSQKDLLEQGVSF